MSNPSEGSNPNFTPADDKDPSVGEAASGENPPEENQLGENPPEEKPPEETEEVEVASIPNAILEAIAEMCHAVNAVYCESIGDFSQLPWQEAPNWQRRSAREGVRHALENPDAAPEDSHRSWLDCKEAEGWVYGKEKDVDLKTHPCMVSYEELPIEQQRKDLLFLAIVNAMS